MTLDQAVDKPSERRPDLHLRMPQGPPFFRARARLPVLGAPASFPFLTREAHTLTYTSGESRLLAVSDLSLSVSCHSWVFPKSSMEPPIGSVIHSSIHCLPQPRRRSEVLGDGRYGRLAAEKMRLPLSCRTVLTAKPGGDKEGRKQPAGAGLCRTPAHQIPVQSATSL